MLNTSVWRRTEHVEHQRVTQTWTCWTPACDAELNMLNTSVWLRTEHVEHQRVTQNWTCWTPACDTELNMLNTSVWHRTEHVEHQRVTRNSTRIYVGKYEAVLPHEDMWMCDIFLRRLEQCDKITNVPWANRFQLHPLVTCTADSEHRTPFRFYPVSGSKFRVSIAVCPRSPVTLPFPCHNLR